MFHPYRFKVAVIVATTLLSTIAHAGTNLWYEMTLAGSPAAPDRRRDFDGRQARVAADTRRGFGQGGL